MAQNDEAFDCGSDVDPWSVLAKAKLLVAHGNDEWVALASIAGLQVRLLSSGRFGEPGEDMDILADRAALALAQPMRDPFADRWLDPADAIRLLAEWRRGIDANRGYDNQTIVAACGISWWKREEIRRFLYVPGVPLKIARSASRALAAAEKRGGALAVWPSRISGTLLQKAKEKGVPVVRVEDGFVRSVGLGSNLVPPSSVIVDRQGIHYDPRMPSDLEAILASEHFSPDLVERARTLRKSIVDARISKYARAANRDTAKHEMASTGRIVLVPGQVEDDMSVLAGGAGLTSNLELLRRVRANEPDAEIWWRPHPDVDAGHRNGHVGDSAALQYADRIVREEAMADLLDAVDAVHVLTSLAGFEALLRGREVTCHGIPFYAGWGLTRDLADVPQRRGRNLSLDELVAGVLLLYPRYLDPVTGLPCPPEVLVERMARHQMPNRLGWIEPVRRFQGRTWARLRLRSPMKTGT
ncbi:beta-3-deoxy-D-manno-oct-2-ulosonic acid transferase [Qipengyuania qiaonensis]|uniref:capsular polysaccharide export protein, LipB/KpsS family n=1 Tax=Qipengyuania qiaonensis TaxID=2867240 RepID=UPI0031EA694A